MYAKEFIMKSHGAKAMVHPFMMPRPNMGGGFTPQAKDVSRGE